MPSTILEATVTGEIKIAGHEAVGAIGGEWIVAGLIVSLAALTWLMHQARLAIEPTAAGTIHFAVIIGLLAGLRWWCRRPMSEAGRIARDAAEYFGVFILVSLIGALASYPVAASSHGYVDAALQRVDDALGFDWPAWYVAVANTAWLQPISRGAYESIYISPAIMLLRYAWAGDRRQALDFVAATWLAAALTLLLFHWLPAVGPFAYLWHGAVAYLPVSDLWQPQVIPELRQHSFLVVDLGHMVGLVSAPSFHAVAAVLMIRFAWPCRALRASVVPLNVAMLLSTPVEGTHYLADLILGAAVAGVAIGLVAWMPDTMRRHRSSTIPPGGRRHRPTAIKPSR